MTLEQEVRERAARAAANSRPTLAMGDCDNLDFVSTQPVD